MLISIIAACLISLPMSWVTDINLTAWCTQENITPAQMIDEFAVLDSILAVEERAAPNYGNHITIESLGERIRKYESLHHCQLPHTALTTDPTCRLYLAARNKVGQDDTCSTLTASIYSIRQITNMPMVRLVLCRETGLREYKFLTEHGALVINEARKSVILYTGGKRYYLWTDPPLVPADTMTADSIPPPQDSAQ